MRSLLHVHDTAGSAWRAVLTIACSDTLRAVSSKTSIPQLLQYSRQWKCSACETLLYCAVEINRNEIRNDWITFCN